MPTLQEFIESQDLAKYVDAFKQEDVTMDTLLEITDSELKELGLKEDFKQKLTK